eukprot:135175-Pleurochrysis_carterae.AAC.1
MPHGCIARAAYAVASSLPGIALHKLQNLRNCVYFHTVTDEAWAPRPMAGSVRMELCASEFQTQIQLLQRLAGESDSGLLVLILAADLGCPNQCGLSRICEANSVCRTCAPCALHQDGLGAAAADHLRHGRRATHSGHANYRHLFYCFRILNSFVEFAIVSNKTHIRRAVGLSPSGR